MMDRIVHEQQRPALAWGCGCLQLNGFNFLPAR
jgi:hypothetical protein